MVVDFLARRALSQDGEAEVTGPGGVTAYCLLRRNDFGPEEGQ